MVTPESLEPFVGSDQELWNLVCDWVSVAEREQLVKWIPRLGERLASVPDGIRQAPPAWVHRAITDEGYPPMALARAIRARRRSRREKGSAIDDLDLEKLIPLPCFRAISHLKLFFCGITDRGANALAAAPSTGALTSLNLTNNQLTGEGVALILESPQLPNLVRLRLRRNNIDHRGVLSIAATPNIKQLRLLDLSENPITPDSIEVIRLAISAECELVTA